MFDSTIQPKAIYKIIENRERYTRGDVLESTELPTYTGNIDIDYGCMGHMTCYLYKGTLNGPATKYEREGYGTPDSISAQGSYMGGKPHGQWIFYRPITTLAGQPMEQLTGCKTWVSVMFTYGSGKIIDDPNLVTFAQKDRTTFYGGSELRAPNIQEVLNNIATASSPKKVSGRRIKTAVERQHE